MNKVAIFNNLENLSKKSLEKIKILKKIKDAKLQKELNNAIELAKTGYTFELIKLLTSIEKRKMSGYRKNWNCKKHNLKSLPAFTPVLQRPKVSKQNQTGKRKLKGEWR